MSFADDETKSKSKESEKDRTAKAKNVLESSNDSEKKQSVLDSNKEVKDSKGISLVDFN